MLCPLLRALKADSKFDDAASVLEKDLKTVYGGSIELTEYFAEVPEDRVTVRIRLKSNEANFGSRIISVSSIQQSYSSAQAQASGAWSSVVVTASENRTTLGSSATEGWWVGTSWIDLKVIDNRDKKRSQFTIPLVAEKKRSNTFGYRTASNVTEETWGQVQQQLLQVMDEVLISVRSE